VLGGEIIALDAKCRPSFNKLQFRMHAEVLGVSSRTLDRDWVLAKAWLRKELFPAQ
jgi:hypothetical protein